MIGMKHAGPGWQALEQHDWEKARACFEAEVARAESAESLEGLSWAAFFQDDIDRLFWAREGAFRLYEQAGDQVGAARLALWTGSDYSDFKGEFAIANGWRQRARRLLEGAGTILEAGWLALLDAEAALIVDEDATKVLEHTKLAIVIARELRDPNIEAVARAIEGLARVTYGDVETGMAGLDEAAAAALGGSLDGLVPIGWIVCYMLQACERARDYDRASQWCERVKAYADQQGIALLQGVCRVYYASYLMWRGKWGEAETELQYATNYLLKSRPPMAAETAVKLAALRRMQGRFDEARELFAGYDWHPDALTGMAEIALAQGRPVDALDCIERALRQVPENNRTARAAVLALHVRAEAACGGFGRAAESLAALQAIAGAFTTYPIRALATHAAGLLPLAQGDAAAAVGALEDAVGLFERGDGPYDAAIARLDLALALAALGRTARASSEATAAAASLSAIGATFDAQRALTLAARGTAAAARDRSGLTERQIEILRLVAQGKSDREIASALVVSEHTVHRHVANILQRLDLPSRAAAAAHAGRAGLL